MSLITEFNRFKTLHNLAPPITTIPTNITTFYTIILPLSSTKLKPPILVSVKRNHLIFDKLANTDPSKLTTKQSLSKYTKNTKTKIDDIFELIHTAAFMPSDVFISITHPPKTDLYHYTGTQYIRNVYTFDKLNLPNINNIATIAIKSLNSFFHTNHSSQFDLIIYNCPKNKYFPVRGEMAFTPTNVNSGQTTDSTTISIFRNEEFAKVLIHEIIHKYKFDTGHITVKHNYNISRPTILLNESIAETLAEALHCVLYAINTSSELFDIISDEILFGLIQTAKILHYFGFASIAEFIASTTKKIVQTTSVFEYHVMKTIFMMHFDEFCDVVIGDGVAGGLMKMIDGVLRDPGYQERVDTIISYLDNMDGYETLNNTFRMTQYDTFGKVINGGGGFERKYRKYKRKYCELKRQYGGYSGGGYSGDGYKSYALDDGLKYRSMKVYTSVDDPNYAVFVEELTKPGMKLKLFDRNVRLFVNDRLLEDFRMEVWDYADGDGLLWETRVFDEGMFEKVFDIIDGTVGRAFDRERRVGMDRYG